MTEQIPANAEQEHTETCPWARAYEQLAAELAAVAQQRDLLATILRATAEGLHLDDDGDPNTIPATAAAAHDAAANLHAQLDRALARVRDLEQFRERLIAAAPAADNAHRQLHAIREARTHTCDRHCAEGGCDFDLGGFVDRVDEILGAPAAGSLGSPRRAQEPAAEQVAQLFHETYERLAPEFGYRTREASAKPWAEVPEQNRALMVATCAEVLAALAALAVQPAALPVRHASPGCGCGINDAGQRYVDPICRPAPKLATGGVSSIIAVSNRFARAATGEEAGTDWVRLRTGSGRQYEGYRSPSCPGDGRPGHRHDIRCVSRELATGGVVEKPVDLHFGLPVEAGRWPMGTITKPAAVPPLAINGCARCGAKPGDPHRRLVDDDDRICPGQGYTP